MRIIYMGTPDFSVPALEKLIEHHEVIAVVTQPDKKKGRGEKLVFTPVKEAAVKAGIDVYQPEKVKAPEFVQVLKDLNPDVMVVAAFGQILSEEVLNVPKYGCINIHASLLPKYRGAAPIQFSIIDGEKETGVTTMYMAKGLDTGDMLGVKKVKIEENETGGSLHDKLSLVGADLIIETLKNVEDGTVKRTKQIDDEATYVGMIDKKMGKIDFEKSAEEIERLIRGLNPWPSAFTYLNGKLLKIWKAQVCEREYDGKPGQIVEVVNGMVYIKCGKGTLKITELQLEGKKRMECEAFLRGFEIPANTVLGE